MGNLTSLMLINANLAREKQMRTIKAYEDFIRLVAEADHDSFDALVAAARRLLEEKRR